MTRKPRIIAGGVIYHFFNISSNKIPIFNTNEDYECFKKNLLKTKERTGMRILSYCIMPNHWHLLLYPVNDGDLPLFMKLLTAQHSQKHHYRQGTLGTGHVYQDRYKSFVVDTQEYLLQLYKYIERNPLKAGLVNKADAWLWSSVRERITFVSTKLIENDSVIDLPRNYLEWLHATDSAFLKKIEGWEAIHPYLSGV